MQEIYISDVNVKIKKDSGGNLDFRQFIEPIFSLDKLKSKLLQKQQECPHIEEIANLNLQKLNLITTHNSLTNEFNLLSKLYVELTDKWREGLDKIDALEREQARLINMYEFKIK